MITNVIKHLLFFNSLVKSIFIIVSVYHIPKCYIVLYLTSYKKVLFFGVLTNSLSCDYACLMSPNKDETGRRLSRMLLLIVVY